MDKIVIAAMRRAQEESLREDAPESPATPSEPIRRIDDLVVRVQDKKAEYIKSTNHFTLGVTETGPTTPAATPEDEQPRVSVEEDASAPEQKPKKKVGRFRALAKLATAPAKVVTAPVKATGNALRRISVDNGRARAAAAAAAAAAQPTGTAAPPTDRRRSSVVSLVRPRRSSEKPRAEAVETIEAGTEKKASRWKRFAKAAVKVTGVPALKASIQPEQGPAAPPAVEEIKLSDDEATTSKAPTEVAIPAVPEVSPKVDVIEAPAPAPEEPTRLAPVPEQLQEEPKPVEEPAPVEPAEPEPTPEEIAAELERIARLERLIRERDDAEARINELRHELRSCHDEFDRLQIEGDSLESMRQELLAIQRAGRRDSVLVIQENGEAAWVEQEKQTAMKRKRDEAGTPDSTTRGINSVAFERYRQQEISLRKAFQAVMESQMVLDAERQVRWRTEYTKEVLRDEDAARRLSTNEDATLIANALKELERAESVERELEEQQDISDLIPAEMSDDDVEQVLREQDAETAGASLLGQPAKVVPPTDTEDQLRKEQEMARLIVQQEEERRIAHARAIDAATLEVFRISHHEVLEKQSEAAIDHERRRRRTYVAKRSKDRAANKMNELRERQREEAANTTRTPQPKRETKPRAVKKLEDRERLQLQLEEEQEQERLMQLAWEQEWERQRQAAREKEQERLLQMAWEQELHRHQQQKKLLEEQEMERTRRAERYYAGGYRPVAISHKRKASLGQQFHPQEQQNRISIAKATPVTLQIPLLDCCGGEFHIGHGLFLQYSEDEMKKMMLWKQGQIRSLGNGKRKRQCSSE